MLEDTMPELDNEDRDKLDKSQFAYVDREGEGHLPIHDESHVRNAIARFNQTEFESTSAKEGARKKILAAARRHGIEVAEDDNVAKPARPSTSPRAKSGSRGARKARA
jgi:uncharacterized protein DUF6582